MMEARPLSVVHAENDRAVSGLAVELDSALFEYNRTLLNLLSLSQELQMWLRESRLLQENEVIAFGKQADESKDEDTGKMENFYDESSDNESQEILSSSLDDSGKIYRRSQSDLIHNEAGLIFSTSFLSNKKGSSATGASKSIDDSFKNLWMNTD